MAHYEGKKNLHHWFPKVNHLVDDDSSYEEPTDSMIIDDNHSNPYIGDFPPKDDYKDGIFY